MVHELAHQWFGDSVSVAAWQDIWLNEGFATYAEWLWNQERGRAGPAAIADYFCGAIERTDPFWDVLPGDPGVDDLFSGPVYVRGAMTLQAVRERVGADAFFEILRTWTSDRMDQTGTTDQFLATAESISGMQLDGLFDTWLFTGSRPASCATARTSPPLRIPAALARPLTGP